MVKNVINKVLNTQVSNINLKNILGGSVTLLPYGSELASFGKKLLGHSTVNEWGASSAQYCYEVWLKHIIFLHESGMDQLPKSMAEIGPGKSLGVGLAAILSGVDEYYAFDVVKYSDPELNISILDELVELFHERKERPSKGWPDYDKYLNDSLFPHHILTDDVLNKTLAPERIAELKDVIRNQNQNSRLKFEYVVPWSCAENTQQAESLDLILSHAVLEHILELKSAYKEFHNWLKPGGWMSHQLHFDSHEQSEKWNGHWGCKEFFWSLAVGKRPWTINRQPLSVHMQLLIENKFIIKCELEKHRYDGIAREDLAQTWEFLSNNDLTCSDAFIQAQKSTL